MSVLTNNVQPEPGVDRSSDDGKKYFQDHFIHSQPVNACISHMILPADTAAEWRSWVRTFCLQTDYC